MPKRQQIAFHGLPSALIHTSLASSTSSQRSHDSAASMRSMAAAEGGGPPMVRFFPSGGSTGGTLSFTFRGQSYGLRINWLTGRADAQSL